MDPVTQSMNVLAHSSPSSSSFHGSDRLAEQVAKTRARKSSFSSIILIMQRGKRVYTIRSAIFEGAYLLRCAKQVTRQPGDEHVTSAVHCHAMKTSQEVVVLQTISKDSSPGLRCVRCPKVQVFVKIFHAKLMNLVWNFSGGGGEGVLGPIFTGYVLLASQSLFPLTVYSVANRQLSIKPKTIDLSARLWGITTEFQGLIPQSLVLRSIVQG